MKPEILIIETPRYRVYSQGNGAFARLERKADGADYFFQGEVAGEFLEMIELLPEDNVEKVENILSEFDEILR